MKEGLKMVQMSKNKVNTMSNDNTDYRAERIHALSDKLETGLRDLINSDNYM